MYEYKAKITKVYDGDGIYHGVIDLGMKIMLERPMRLRGVDTPEIRGREKEAGVKVREYVKSLILDKEIVIKTYKDKGGKYGRLLVDIILPNGKLLQDELLKKGYAKAYNGGKKKIWSKKDLEKIINT